MPLADVLSAVRQLILDPIDLSTDMEARRADYHERFPALRPEEIEDLAKMEPKRIRTYTDSIFSGQTSVLEDKFEITFQLLEERFLKVKNEKFYPFTFIREMHVARPWRDVTTEGLGRNLVEYLRNDRPDIREIAPEVVDLAEMELQSLHVIRAQNDIVSARDSLTVEQLQAMPVGKLMEVELIVPSYVQFATFDFNVPAIRSYFYQNDHKLPADPIETRQVQSAAGRNTDFFVRWRELSPPVYEMLTELTRSEPTALENLAAVIADDLPSDTEEVEIFRKFFELTADLVTAGIVVLGA